MWIEVTDENKRKVLVNMENVTQITDSGEETDHPNYIFFMSILSNCYWVFDSIEEKNESYEWLRSSLDTKNYKPPKCDLCGNPGVHNHIINHYIEKECNKCNELDKFNKIEKSCNHDWDIEQSFSQYPKILCKKCHKYRQFENKPML